MPFSTCTRQTTGFGPGINTSMEKVLFITNALYLDTRNREGGVRNCTNEFIELLGQRFGVVTFPVTNHISLAYRLRVRLGINRYNDYKPGLYKDALEKVIRENDIRFVFLNLSNTVRFSALIKSIDPGKMKVILCSHGNETGDFLHEVVRFPGDVGRFKRMFSSWTLGGLLKAEAFYRIRDLDMVLNVSPVEDQIEKWLGARNTFMVPRVIRKDLLDWRPVPWRVGFIGDISHTPNRTGVIALCEALQAAGTNPVKLRLVGGPENYGQEIAARYPFVEYLGYLEEGQLRAEAATWSYFLNLVFYYSRGVSTKLAKGLGWGLPVISTVAGNRGYRWTKGQLLTAGNAAEMARMILDRAGDSRRMQADQRDVEDVVASSPGFDAIMEEVYPLLLQL